jgi:hypothetical protein
LNSILCSVAETLDMPDPAMIPDTYPGSSPRGQDSGQVLRYSWTDEPVGPEQRNWS